MGASVLFRKMATRTVLMIFVINLLFIPTCYSQTSATQDPSTADPSSSTSANSGSTTSSGSTSSSYNESHIEYPPYDGWFNNPSNPSYGGAERPLYRRVAARYKDGSYEPRSEADGRPNPIDLSDKFLNGSTGYPSHYNRTAFLVFFGQQVVEEVLDAQRPGCPPEYFNIKIPKGHPRYDPEEAGDREMPFLRSRYDQTTGFSPNNPRQQLNEISPYIDGTLFYGPNKAWTDAIRALEGGRLAALNDSDSTQKYFPAKKKKVPTATLR